MTAVTTLPATSPSTTMTAEVAITAWAADAADAAPGGILEESILGEARSSHEDREGTTLAIASGSSHPTVASVPTFPTSATVATRKTAPCIATSARGVWCQCTGCGSTPAAGSPISTTTTVSSATTESS